MNVLSRPLFDMPPEMVEGTGITSMGMEEGPPSSMGEQEARDIGGMIAGNLAGRIEQTELGIDGAEDELGMMNALRGEEQSEEEYRDELAELVGPKDAAATPNSVLALIQPTLAMVQMAEQMGTQGGGTGGIGDLGGMGDLGDMSALMGGMGGDSLGGLATMLPQEEPMPMEMMAVEENIAGVMPDQEMPTQMFALGGEAKSVQEYLDTFKGSWPEYPVPEDKTFLENLLQIGTPALAAGLMGEPGKEWRTGLTALAGSSAAALAEQRKKKEFEQKLPYERDLKLLPLAISANQNEQEKLWDLKLAGMKTGSTSELAKAEANLARAEASRDPEQIARAKAEVGRIATQISDADAARETSQQGTRGTIYAPVWKDINKRYQALSDETGLAQNYARKMQIAADLAEKYGSSGAFGETRLELGKISEFLSESFGLSREVATAFQEKLNLPAGEEISYGELLKSVGAQGTLLFTQLIPGNLNQSEVDLVSAVGANLFTTKEGAALIRDLSARGARRAQQLEQGLLKTRDEWLAANGRDLASTKANPMLFQTIMQQTERDIKASWEVEATVEEQDKVHLENILAPQVETLMGDLDDPNYWESQARKKGKGNENIESLFSAANVPRGSTDEAEIIRNASENMWNGLLASKLGKASPEIQKRVIVGMLESFYKAESRLPVVVGKRFGEILSGVLEIMGGRKTRTGSEPFTPGAGG